MYISGTPNSEYFLFTSFLRRGDGVVHHGESVISTRVDNTKVSEKLLIFSSWRVINVLRRLTAEKVKSCEVLIN